MTFSYSGTKISSVVFDVGTSGANTSYGQSLTVSYSYDANGRLETATKAFGTPEATSVTYHYPSGTTALDKVTDARGNSTEFTYAAGKLSQIKDRKGENWGFASCTADAPGTQAICLTDPGTPALTQVWSTDSKSNLRAKRDQGDKDSAGADRFNRSYFNWYQAPDARQNRLLNTTDQNGHQSAFDWTVLGDLKSTSRPGGDNSTLTTNFTYQTNNLLNPIFEDLTASTTLDRTSQFFPNADGTLNHVIDPRLKTTTFAYHTIGSRTGLLASIEDPNHHITRYGDSLAADRGYDPSGAPKTITDARQHAAGYIYDFLGRQRKMTDRESKIWLDDYDLRGNHTRSADPLHSAYFCYNQNNALTLSVPPKAGGVPSCSLAGTDSNFNGLDGYSTKTDYDARGMVSQVLTKSEGDVRKSVYSYFADGMLKQIKEPRSFDKTTGAELTTLQLASYEYYNNNRVSAFTDEGQDNTAAGRATVAYFPNGQISKSTAPPSSGGQLLVTDYSYNNADQVASVQVSGHSDPVTLVPHPTNYGYNAFGEQIKVTTPEGDAASPKYFSQMSYNKNGQLETSTDPYNKVTTRHFDDAGNMDWIEQPTGSGLHTHTGYSFSETNQVDTETYPSEVAAGTHTITYVYDNNGRQILRKDNGTERSLAQSYFDDGTIKDQAALGAGSSPQRSVFSYDSNQNLWTVKSADNLSDPIVANISSLTFGYSTQDELKTVAETIFPPGGGTGITKNSSYGYQQDGLMKDATIDSLASAYVYQLNGMAKSFTPPGSDPFTYANYANGDLNTMDLPNGARVTALYDAADRLSSRIVRETLSDTSTKLSAWENVTYNLNDNRKLEDVTQAQPTGAAPPGQSDNHYDRVERLIYSQNPFEPGKPSTFTLDDAGNTDDETGFVFNSTTALFDPTNFHYDYVNNYLTHRTPTSPAGAAVDYTFDHFGNQTAESSGGVTSSSNVYDAASHPSSTTMGATTVGFTYDGLGRMATRTQGSSVTLFFHDGKSDQIAVETNGTGTAGARYILDAYRQPVGQDQGSNRSWYVTDNRGNLTQLLDSDLSGPTDVRAVFGYDPYGKPKAQLTKVTEVWDSRLRFQMAPLDAATGNYNLGPRLLNPSINRFVGADFYAASSANVALQMDPLTGNRYLYAGANPAGLIDNGHEVFDAPCWLKKLFDKSCKKPEPVKHAPCGLAPASADGDPMWAATACVVYQYTAQMTQFGVPTVGIQPNVFRSDSGGASSPKDENGRMSEGSLPELTISPAQFGKKVAKHAKDFGLDPSNAADRTAFLERIKDIRAKFDEVRQGPWNPDKGGANDYLFFQRGGDVVLAKGDGSFVSILRNGQSNNWYQGAKVL